MKQLLKRILPQRVKNGIRRLISDPEPLIPAMELRNSTSFDFVGQAGPLIEDVCEHIKTIPGWFSVDDCSHFYTILSLQSAYGMKGDLFEIGSYHGRSTALMGKCLKEGERIVVCDVFDSDDGERYPNQPSPEQVMTNILRVTPDLDPSRIVIHRCPSDALQLGEDERFRFIHIDGGHSYEQVYADLRLASGHLLTKGIMAMDDYGHPRLPGVNQAVDQFLSENPQFLIVADLNRHGAMGRKLYAMKN